MACFTSRIYNAVIFTGLWRSVWPIRAVAVKRCDLGMTNIRLLAIDEPRGRIAEFRGVPEIEAREPAQIEMEKTKQVIL